MIIEALLLGIQAPPTVADPNIDADPFASASADPERVAPPWAVLTGKRLQVRTTAGLRAEGTFLGLHDGNAVLEDDGGQIVSIATADVAEVRTVVAARAEEPPVPTIPTADLPETMSTSHTRDDELLRRLRSESLARRARGAAIAGGVLSSISAVGSIVAEGFNIRRWSLTEYKCGVDYYDGEACGWSDDDYAVLGVGIASSVAIPLHIMAGPIALAPTARLRRHIGYRKARGRQIAAWVLWGAGFGSLVIDQAVSWTQVASSTSICESGSYDAECTSVNDTRGAPPPFYLISAGLTLSSAILALIDANDVARHADQDEATAARPAASMSIFPITVTRGGGLGVAGRF
jgi:hypothetical protein